MELAVVLDEYDDEARIRRETAEDVARNNAVFTRAICDLFSLLAPLGHPSIPTRPMSLGLRAYSPSDWWRRGDPSFARNMRRFRTTEDLFDARYQHSFLELSETSGTALDFITEFHIPTPFAPDKALHYRHISPSACCRISSKLTGLESIDWVLLDDEKMDLALRTRLRIDSAEGLTLMPSSLHSMWLSYWRSWPRNHNMSSQDLLGPAGLKVDPLSREPSW
ncbi:Nucleoporin nup84 [Pestalotiopsis sp. IQ-011]